jgi:hypothetical protein
LFRDQALLGFDPVKDRRPGNLLIVHDCGLSRFSIAPLSGKRAIAPRSLIKIKARPGSLVSVFLQPWEQDNAVRRRLSADPLWDHMAFVAFAGALIWSDAQASGLGK